MPQKRRRTGLAESREAVGTLAAGGSALACRGIDYRLSAAGSALSLTVAMHAGKTFKGGAGAGAMKGSLHSDIFWCAGGSGSISGIDGRDVAVFGQESWGRTTIKATSGTMTLIFSGLEAGSVTSSLAGSTMTFARKAGASQKISVSGWNAETHKVVYGGAMAAFDAWKAAAPTKAQTAAMRKEVWQKAGLAAA